MDLLLPFLPEPVLAFSWLLLLFLWDNSGPLGVLGPPALSICLLSVSPHKFSSLPLPKVGKSRARLETNA